MDMLQLRKRREKAMALDELKSSSLKAIMEFSELLLKFEEAQKIYVATKDDFELRKQTVLLCSWLSAHSFIGHVVVLRGLESDLELVGAARECLEMLKHYGPEASNHACGSPESVCDMLCVEHANFSDNIVRLTKVVDKFDGGRSGIVEKADAMWKAASDFLFVIMKHYPNIENAGPEELLKMPALDASATAYGRERGFIK